MSAPGGTGDATAGEATAAEATAAEAGPRVSVVIPCYNATAFLADAVASARAQSYPVAEVIVIDDASADGTAEAADALGVTVIRQPANRGPSAARNAGIARATGDLVAFLDADDAWLPWHVELCVDALARHPRAAVASTAVMLWEDPLPPRPERPRVEIPVDPVLVLLERTLIPQTGAVARKSALAEVGGYDEGRRYAEDYDVWLRIAARHDLARVHAVGSRHRRHPGQATRALLRMMENGFEVRLQALAAVTAQGDPARSARAAAALVAALDTELHSMWYLRDAGAFEYLLELAARIPNAAAVGRRWAMRRRFGWHLWHAAKAAKDRLLPA